MLVSVASSPSGPGIKYRFAKMVAEGRAETFGVIVLIVVVKRCPNPSYLSDTGQLQLGWASSSAPNRLEASYTVGQSADADKFVTRGVRERIEIVLKTSIRDVSNRRLVAAVIKKCYGQRTRAADLS